MSVTYLEAPADARQMLRELLRTKFTHIESTGAQIEIQFAVSSTESPPIKQLGIKADRKVEKIDAKDRKTNPHDVRFLIDSEAWNGRSQRRREALLHGLLTSLEPLRDKKTGELKTDDDSRPLFKIVPGDWLATGYESTLKEYGEDSTEYRQFVTLKEIVRQLHFNWTDDRAEQDQPDFDELVSRAKATAQQEAGEPKVPFPGDASDDPSPDET